MIGETVNQHRVIEDLDLRWDPLRDYPRFQALIQKGDKVF